MVLVPAVAMGGGRGGGEPRLQDPVTNQGPGKMGIAPSMSGLRNGRPCCQRLWLAVTHSGRCSRPHEYGNSTINARALEGGDLLPAPVFIASPEVCVDPGLGVLNE